MNENKFEKALSVDVTPMLKKKGSSPYLPWATAFAEFKKVYPKGNFQFIKNKDGGYVFEQRISDVANENSEQRNCVGYFVRVMVTNGEIGDDEIYHELMLPIMDFKNKANMNFTIMEVNKALWRGLAKGVALFGVGITTYAGEEYWQYEIGAELDELRETVTNIAKEIVELDSDSRTEVVKTIGYNGHSSKIKDTEEATEKIEKLNEILTKAKEKKEKEEKKPQTKTTKKTEEK